MRSRRAEMLKGTTAARDKWLLALENLRVELSGHAGGREEEERGGGEWRTALIIGKGAVGPAVRDSDQEPVVYLWGNTPLKLAAESGTAPNCFVVEDTEGLSGLAPPESELEDLLRLRARAVKMGYYSPAWFDDTKGALQDVLEQCQV